MSELRNTFLAGLLILIPLLATVYVVYWTFTFVDNLLKPALLKIIGFYFPGLSWIALVALIFALGALGRFAIGNKVIEATENFLRKIPVVRTIYSAAKEASKAILVSETERIKGVVLVEYPRKGIYAIGFTTGTRMDEAIEKTGKKLVNVFIPTSPNPTSGLVVLVPEEELIYLDMSVEDALRVVISGGFTK
ncbi:DUF502 domain-containing protein [Archaeoglobus veneficus]|uniref:DUF502 domain-containing protein n=1 Tax=Archaeoglobus veneficus (strain DSM 11195 / SNP6) TaxID=693661 RepID=F2KNA5_ARCVS|nr:DUF502 domain-containing protein [Archaeoglobus veneficus]AEA46206.1 protein of unknown function DUF502 [Archaeoglobus veneficus SNP6]